MMTPGGLVPPGAPRRPVRLSGHADAPRMRGWAHLAALLAAVPAGVALAARSGWRAEVVLYTVALVALYGVSAAYHLAPMSSGSRRRMRRADHAMIYLFIAAAFTPFCRYAIQGPGQRVVLALVWAAALVGVALKLVSFERTRLGGVVLFFVLSGLMLVALPVELRRLDAAAIVLLAAMVLLYSSGAAVLAARRPELAPDVFGYHELWHVMVVAATACYFLVLWSML